MKIKLFSSYILAFLMCMGMFSCKTDDDINKVDDTNIEQYTPAQNSN